MRNHKHDRIILLPESCPTPLVQNVVSCCNQSGFGKHITWGESAEVMLIMCFYYEKLTSKCPQSFSVHLYLESYVKFFLELYISAQKVSDFVVVANKMVNNTK